MTNTLETPLESPLEELQFVWALESSKPGRLCVWGDYILRQCFVMVFRSEQDAIDHIRNRNWLESPTGVQPIELSLESVIQQSLEQKPDADGYPCVGYVWLPEEQLVYTCEMVEKGGRL